MPAPIALFTYNRPWHTRQTIEALKLNELADKSELFIFSDAAKTMDHSEGVQQVREYIHNIKGFKKVHVIEREKNFGLANSIIDGVTKIVNEFGMIIVLEDDLVTSPYFLRYMNDGLKIYENDERVISIHGYTYPVDSVLPETYFLLGADCWGWATWKRGWKIFEANGQKLLAEVKRRKKGYDFNFYGSFPYTRMLKAQIIGKNNSWAVRWYASAFLENKLTLYPGQSLVVNIGTDGSGTHSAATDIFTGQLVQSRVEIKPIPVEENIDVKKKIAGFHKKSMSIWDRIKNLIHRFL